ncbi:FAD:protein FMN transferase [Alteromonas aestuariivivens]|uniref:FAD:protein FMN transferase n=1 Tax=Alteromonas aestuariivivens TaxID=1938339 RepID=A0A3D8MD08_9ALTE|nr:FAD:protein FMN transferase [Alteromonas aestuariivivens]RDV28175.1 FAD:protein FMN transferase [Alteromonas aestuariivivens]
MRLKRLLLGALSLASAAQAEWFIDDAAIMGTNIEVQVWADSARQGQQAIDTVFAEMERVNQLMSPYIDSSELSRVNRLAANEDVVVSEEMFNLIRYANKISQQTGGAFDITFASVGFLYNYRAAQRPDEQTINANLDAINYRHLELDEHNSSIRFRHPNVKIDLGGIAKGHAVDKAVDQLITMGIEHAMVTAGGDTRLLGDRLGRPWMVGIRDPRNPDRQAVMLPLSDIAISTSGDYERYFEEEGQRYHHIISPKTGKSTYEVQSVSILGPSSTTNDALSTSVFVLGVQAGIDLINQIPEVEAIILDDHRRMHFSSGLTQ